MAFLFDSAKVSIYDYAGLKKLAGSMPPDLVEGLIGERSVNILVGDSNLGKTPLGVTLGVAVASGVPFLGRKVRQGRVLYCDSETPLPELPRMLEAISRTAGLESPPADFFTYSVNAPADEDETVATSPADAVFSAVSQTNPQLVVVDPLRTFWPHAPKDAESALNVFNPLRKACKTEGCTWLLLHHRRKHSMDRVVSLIDDPHGWMQESAGSQAIVNHTDARLGVEPVSGPGNAELVLGGFVRSRGRIPPIYLAREYDRESGDPVGYQALIGLTLLPPTHQDAFMKLPNRFRRVDVLNALGGTSSSGATVMVNHCVSLGLVRRIGKEYEKVDSLEHPQ
jgi:hypothetical protein